MIKSFAVLGRDGEPGGIGEDADVEVEVRVPSRDQ